MKCQVFKSSSSSWGTPQLWASQGQCRIVHSCGEMWWMVMARATLIESDWVQQDKKCACSDWSSEQLTPFAQSFTCSRLHPVGSPDWFNGIARSCLAERPEQVHYAVRFSFPCLLCKHFWNAQSKMEGNSWPCVCEHLILWLCCITSWREGQLSWFTRLWMHGWLCVCKTLSLSETLAN